jgi:hypothetical protein
MRGAQGDQRKVPAKPREKIEQAEVVRCTRYLHFQVTNLRLQSAGLRHVTLLHLLQLGYSTVRVLLLALQFTNLKEEHQ